MPKRTPSADNLFLRFIRFLFNILWYTSLMSVVFKNVEAKNIGICPTDDTDPFKDSHSQIKIQLCRNHFEAANKLPGAKYSVVSTATTKKLKSSRRFAATKKIEEMGKKIQKQQIQTNIFQQQISKAVKQILGEVKLTEAEKIIIYNNLIPMMADHKAIQSTKTFICGSAINSGMGRFIADHWINGTPLPTMIAFSLKFDFDYEGHEKQLLTTREHYLDQHISMLIVDNNNENSALLNQFNEVLQASTDNIGRVNPEKATQLVAAITKLNPQVCDAWVDDQNELNAARESDDVFTYFKENPERLIQVKIFNKEKLQSPNVKKVADYIFLENSEVWQEKNNQNTCQM